MLGSTEVRADTLLAAMCLLTVLLPAPGWSGEAVPTEQDPVHEKRAVHLAEQLRCLVCQNQSIAESNAELAVDLRRQIREQIAQGKTDAEIADYMVQRYGDFVLYRPPVRATRLLLWFGPPLLLVIGIAVLVGFVRRRRERIAQRPLSDDERREAERLLQSSAESEQR